PGRPADLPCGLHVRPLAPRWAFACSPWSARLRWRGHLNTKGVRLMSTVDSFAAKQHLSVGGTDYGIYALDAVEGAEKLPYSLQLLLENLLRTEDGASSTADHVRALANWDPEAEPSVEIQFTPGRVIMQDFTGVPCVVDLATMREAMQDLGGDPEKINPLAPAEMVIDHSVMIDVAGR